MKALKIIIAVLSILLISSFSHASKLGTLRVTLVEGNVEISNEAALQTMTGAVNLPLMEGDEVIVHEAGRAEIQMNNGSLIRLGKNSALLIDELGKDSFRYFLQKGRAYVNFKDSEGKSIIIDSPVTSLSAGNGSKFGIDIYENRSARISVLSGVVDSHDGYSSTEIKEGQDYSLGDTRYGNLGPIDRQGEWLVWNRGRDDIYEPGEYSARHLPPELHPYSYDFDSGGDWIYTSGYGYVWRPKVYVETGWSPYRQGRWLHRGSDYVWISHEPWGWAPYHYGRWAYRASYGWFWVPPSRHKVYWAPAYVGWVNTPTYVGWIPLAPEDTYYGYGYFGPRSINVLSINFHRHSRNIVYKNVYAGNAVNIVYRDSFKRGRHKHYRAKHNPFIRKSVYWGRPEYKPRKAVIRKSIEKQRHRKYRPGSLRVLKRNKTESKVTGTRVVRKFEKRTGPGKIVKKKTVRRVKENGNIRKSKKIIRTEKKAVKNKKMHARRYTGSENKQRVRDNRINNLGKFKSKQERIVRKARTVTNAKTNEKKDITKTRVVRKVKKRPGNQKIVKSTKVRKIQGNGDFRKVKTTIRTERKSSKSEKLLAKRETGSGRNIRQQDTSTLNSKKKIKPEGSEFRSGKQSERGGTGSREKSYTKTERKRERRAGIQQDKREARKTLRNKRRSERIRR